MLDTGLIRRKIDGLSAADGADTYWRDRMLDALNEVDRLTAELENRKQQFDAYCDAEEINNAGLEREISTLQSALDAADKRNDDQKRLSDNARYEVGIMSAITGRRDSETLTEAVTRVCHRLAELRSACDHVADLYGEDSERGLAAAEILRYRRIVNTEQTADIGHDALAICQCAHSKPLHFNNGQCVAAGCGCKCFTFEGTR